MSEHWFFPLLEGFISRSGSLARIHYVLERNPQGFRLKELVRLTGLKPSTIKNHGLRTLFNFQVVTVDVDEDRGHVYKLVEDQHSAASPEREKPKSPMEAA